MKAFFLKNATASGFVHSALLHERGRESDRSYAQASYTPKPVLVKCSFLYINGPNLSLCWQIVLSFFGVLSLCLSGACLGKMFVFIHKWLKKTVFIMHKPQRRRNKWKGNALAAFCCLSHLPPARSRLPRRTATPAPASQHTQAPAAAAPDGSRCS